MRVMRDAVNHFGESDTIAAIATAPGEAGIAVIRVSGPASLHIADAVMKVNGRKPSDRPSGTFTHGHVVNHLDKSEHADEAICLIFRAPRSYTGEDVMEIQCHGGRHAAERTLRAALGAGARLAEPGEFTRRAFLNGKMDLLQAEAVLDLIKARSDSAANMAVRQLNGMLTAWTTTCYSELVSTLAILEANLDFADEEVPAIDTRAEVDRLGSSVAHMQEMLATWSEGRLIREGALLVIAGQPNAGKSTLMNRLLNLERSIVSETPGTTRDVVEDTVLLNGIEVRIADTAGLRATECAIEQEGIRRAKKAIRGADAVLYVVDGSRPVQVGDHEHLRETGIDRTILVLNKSDLGIEYRAEWMAEVQKAACSAKTGVGFDSLVDAIKARICSHSDGMHPVMISGRHKEILDGVLTHTIKAREILAEGKSEGLVLAASQLHTAVDLLGTMTGKNYTEDLLDTIFSRFCIGK